MRTILITGGAGFIGSNLTKRLLSENNKVIVVDNLLTGQERNIDAFRSNPLFTFLNHDVTSPLPSNLKADAVFHLASPASPNHHSPVSYHALPMQTMMVNTVGTKLLLEFAKENSASFLYTSTSEVYGDPLVHPQVEEYRGNVSSIGPRSVYDEAKRFGETLTMYYARNEGVNSRIVRIFNTYGPNMSLKDMRMVIQFTQQALANEPITIFGDGTQTRSLCYVDDLVEGLIRLMFYDGTKGEVVNLGSPEEHTVHEYATIIKRLTNSTSEIVLSEGLPEDDPLKRQPDISKAKKLLNWEPTTSLDDGLTQLITYIKSL